MDNAHDIIQTALDILQGDSQEVTVTLLRPGRRVTHVDGELTGLGLLGDDGTLTVKVDGVNTLVSLDHVVDISLAS